MLSAAIFVHAELTGKAFTGFNRGRSYANTESLQKSCVTSICNFYLIPKTNIYNEKMVWLVFFPTK